MGLQGQKKARQAEAASEPLASATDPDDQTLADRKRHLAAEGSTGRTPTAQPPSRGGKSVEATTSKSLGKRQAPVDLEDETTPKRGRQSEPPRATLVAEDEGAPSDPVTLACPSKTVQFANHMILGSQMELSEIEELPKKQLRDAAGRAFRLQASASIDMWLCMKRALNAAERSRKLYEDGKAKVTEASKALQDHANLLLDMQAAERQVKAQEARIAELVSALGAAELAAKDAEVAKEAVQVAWEESERAKASEIESAVREAVKAYRSSPEFTTLLDREVGSEMADLIHRFKRYNPGRKLYLNFIADPPPLPEGITEEMIEDYEWEENPVDADPSEVAAVPQTAEEPPAAVGDVEEAAA
ncbi:hypothetical protein ACE6H2_026285 [Prunus campanulata]